jgi:hypothetical protein
MFVPEWVLIGIAAYLLWTAFMWLFCVTGGEALRSKDIGYERAVLDGLHSLVSRIAKRTAFVVAS